MLDIGSHSIRAGYAGDDTPKSVIPTSYGYTVEQSEGEDVDMETVNTTDGQPGEQGLPDQAEKPKNLKLYIGQHGPSLFRTGMEVGNPMRGGLSESFPSFVAECFRAHHRDARWACQSRTSLLYLL